MKTEIVQGYFPGCIGRITQLHADYYSRHAGFGLYFEAKVAAELANFLQRYKDGRDGLWLALVDGEIEGSIAIDGEHAGDEGAHLRWFILSERLRGTGCGKQLLQAALDSCKAKSWDRTYLWTFEGLHAARHLYEKFGFRLTKEQRGVQWGKEVNEQLFELRVPPGD